MDVSFVNKNGQTLRGVLSRPKKGKNIGVLFVHGFKLTCTGPNFIFKDLETLLVQKGYTCLRFDRAHTGRSDGDKRYFSLRESFEDVSCALDFLHMKKVLLIGHSLGGLMNIFLARDLRVVGVVALSSNLNFSIPRLAILQEITQHLQMNLWHHIQTQIRFILERRKYPVREVLCHISVPLLLIYDPLDKFVSYTSVTSLFSSQKNVTLLPVQGIGHFYKENKDTVVAEVISWIASFVK